MITVGLANQIVGFLANQIADCLANQIADCSTNQIADCSTNQGAARTLLRVGACAFLPLARLPSCKFDAKIFYCLVIVD